MTIPPYYLHVLEALFARKLFRHFFGGEGERSFHRSSPRSQPSKVNPAGTILDYEIGLAV